jgi:hypothetical protein
MIKTLLAQSRPETPSPALGQHPRDHGPHSLPPVVNSSKISYAFDDS